ncbi:hypothetical protein CRE_17007 [Caenorhabditis remanei]|uniref:Uncharacterized protein n=1 Tax=Caenorhabditis remanei TaxID=31234 RepID=E3N7Y0_CAERE|nr:hypothetical protein CRE_17007 [Caenorhabditis remanei]
MSKRKWTHKDSIVWSDEDSTMVSWMRLLQLGEDKCAKIAHIKKEKLKEPRMLFFIQQKLLFKKLSVEFAKEENEAKKARQGVAEK